MGDMAEIPKKSAHSSLYVQIGASMLPVWPYPCENLRCIAALVSL